MRFPRNKQIFRGTFDVGPFAGVFFLLLIFVLLNSSLVFTPGVPIHLPETEELPGTAGKTVVVAVDSAGQIYFDHQITQEKSLRERLTEEANAAQEPLTLIVQADEDVKYKTIVS